MIGLNVKLSCYANTHKLRFTATLHKHPGRSQPSFDSVSIDDVRKSFLLMPMTQVTI